MDAREQAAALMVAASKEPDKLNRIDLALCSVTKHLVVLDEEILKLRKELRTRNGGENG